MIPVDIYKKYSVARHEIHCTLRDKYITSNEITISAKALGVYKGGKIHLAFEDELQYIFDFIGNDMIFQGKSIIEKGYDDKIFVNEYEEKYLKGCLTSYTSFFQVVSINEENNTVELADLLNKESEPFNLTDINFSHSTDIGVFMFSRIISLDSGYITSGASFTFTENKQYLIFGKLNRHDNKSVFTDKIKRFKFFLKLNRELGMKIIFKDI